MRVHDLRQIHADYQHIYLSPHFDDAALSCGGAIAAARARGERVLVVTICSAAPAPATPLNPLALELHANWGLSAETVVAVRSAEDAQAMALLDADFFYLDALDAIYRHPAYCTRETLFAPPVASDPLAATLHTAIAAIQRRASDATIYGPLGVGNHVDHLATFAALSELAADSGLVAFYEDLPYALMPGSVEQRLQQIERPLAPEIIAISSLMTRKIESIAAYSSQMVELFTTAEQMPPAMRAYAESLLPAAGTFAERRWR